MNYQDKNKRNMNKRHMNYQVMNAPNMNYPNMNAPNMNYPNMNNQNMQLCTGCGNAYPSYASNCPGCGRPSAFIQASSPYNAPMYPGQKDRLTYILLGLFLGGLGIHNFYAGEKGKGIGKLLVTLLLGWTGIALIAIGVACIIEVCITKADANGIPFKGM